MPVIAKADRLYPEDLLSRHHVSGFHQNPHLLQQSVLLNGNTLDRSVFIFRAHHRACAERRKQGLRYELQVEAFRAGKYLEKLDCPTTAKHSLSTAKEPEKHSQAYQETFPGTKPESVNTHCFKESPTSPLATHQHCHQPNDPLMDSKPGLNNNFPHSSAMLSTINAPQTNRQSDQQILPTTEVKGRVVIKTEPGNEEHTHHHAQSPTDTRPPKPTSLIPGEKSSSNNSTGAPRKKRRRYSIPTSLSANTPRSASYSDDTGDDLSLSAEDCISGVISTPPIKPLEEGDEALTTPSPTAINTPILKLSRTRSASSRTTPSPLSDNAALGQSRRLTASNINQDSSFTTSKSDSLVQDLDDFTKVMEMVTKEQREMERQATTQMINSGQGHSPPKPMMSPPPYYPPGGQPTTIPPKLAPISSQSSYMMQQQFNYPAPPSVSRRLSVQDGAMEARRLARPNSLQMQKHQQQPMVLSGASPQVDNPQLISPNILSKPQTQITNTAYSEPSVGCAVTTPDHVPMNTQPPQTPTTPLDRYPAFSLPSTQKLVRSPTQPRPFFPQTAPSYPYPQKLSSPAGLLSNSWPQTQQAHSLSPQRSETLMPQINPVLTGPPRRPSLPHTQGWGIGGRMRDISQTLPQFPSQFSAGTAPESNTGLSLSTSHVYRNHSELTHSYNHHHPL